MLKKAVKNKNAIRDSFSDRVFGVVNTLLLCALLSICLRLHLSHELLEGHAASVEVTTEVLATKATTTEVSSTLLKALLHLTLHLVDLPCKDAKDDEEQCDDTKDYPANNLKYERRKDCKQNKDGTEDRVSLNKSKQTEKYYL